MPDVTDAPRRRARARAIATGLAAACAVVGVVAAFFISNPVVGIPAAIVLTVALVGMAVALLLPQWRGWADGSWRDRERPRGTVSFAASRRRDVMFGLALIAVGASSLAGLLVFGGLDAFLRGEAERGSAQVILAVVAAIAVGFALAISSARRPPATVASDDRPVDSGSDDEWLAMPVASPTMSLLAGRTDPLLLLLPGLWAIAIVVETLIDDPRIALVVILTVSASMVLAFVSVVRRRFNRPIEIARGGRAVRRGRHETQAGDVTAARVLPSSWTPDAPARSLVLELQGARGVRLPIALRSRGRLALSESQTRRLRALLDQAPIDLPRDATDPRGKFSKLSYPTHVEKRAAIDLVTDPPGDGEPLPITLPSAT